MGRRKDARFGLPAHVHVVFSKGKAYFYYQRARATAGEQERVKLVGEPFTDEGLPNAEWWESYREAGGLEKPDAPPGTFSALIGEYKQSPEWKALSEGTKAEWTRLLRRVEETWGPLRVARLEARHVLSLRDRYAETPAQTNNMLRALSSMVSWSVPRGWCRHNPALSVKKLKGGEGYAPWSWEAISLFREKGRRDLWHAAALALYTGQRQGDVLRMGREDIKDGLMAVLQEKTGKKLWIPMHRDLKVVLREIESEKGVIVRNRRGGEWTSAGFRSSWDKELDRDEFAILRTQRCVFHGLRKSAVVMLLEAGCTDAEVAAITGQSREMVAHYARQVNQKKLAAAAILKWENAARRETRRRERQSEGGRRRAGQADVGGAEVGSFGEVERTRSAQVKSFSV